MLVLDTDHLRLLLRGDSPHGERIRARLAVAGASALVTVITFEEHVRGWLAKVSSAKVDEQLLFAYSRLAAVIREYRDITLLDCDADALAIFNKMRANKIRIPTMGLRIAAIALTRGATLLTRNARDFGRVPGLRIEDWTA